MTVRKNDLELIFHEQIQNFQLDIFVTKLQEYFIVGIFRDLN